MNLKSLPCSERPRERLAAKGAEALSDAELLAVIMRTGLAGKNAVELSQELLAESGSLQKLFTTPLSQLQRMKGVGPSKALQLKACLELAKRLLASGEDASSLPAALQKIQAETAFAEREVFHCVFLDARNRVLKVEVVALGTVNASAIHPREVFKTAFAENAAAIALVHNHPSGSVEPSEEDVETTKAMGRLCNLLGLSLAGSFIVTSREIGGLNLESE